MANIVSPVDPSIIVYVQDESLPVWESLGWTTTTESPTAGEAEASEYSRLATIDKSVEIVSPYDSTVVSTILAESLPVWLALGWTKK